MTAKSVAQALEEQLNPSSPKPPNPTPYIDELVGELRTLMAMMATDVHIATTPPSGPDDGDHWYHPDEKRLYVYVKE